MTQSPPRVPSPRSTSGGRSNGRADLAKTGRGAPPATAPPRVAAALPGIAIALGAGTRLSPTALMARLQHLRHEHSQADADTLAQGFHRDDRRHVRKFAATSGAHADVTQQFPFLAFALACRLPSSEHRRAAEDAISRGERLSRIARAAGVPMWTRGLPSSACIDPGGPLPASNAFTRAIADILRQHSRQGRDLRGIVRSIAIAHAAAGEEFAAWLAARQHDFCLGDQPTGPVRMLILWYLFGNGPPCLGRDLIVKHWTRDMSLEMAFHAMRNFARRIELELLVGPRGLADPWYRRQSFKGLDFVPLTTSLDIRAEARRNQNCLDLYGQRLATRRSRLWSIRASDGICLANIEVCLSPTRANTPCIVQIKAPNNQPASPLVTGIAQLWLRHQMRAFGIPDMRPAIARAPDAGRWQEIISPLAEAGVLPPWAQACPTNADLHMMDCELAAFAATIPTTGSRAA